MHQALLTVTESMFPDSAPVISKPFMPGGFPGAGVDVDVSVAQTTDGEHHTVGVEG